MIWAVRVSCWVSRHEPHGQGGGMTRILAVDDEPAILRLLGKSDEQWRKYLFY